MAAPMFDEPIPQPLLCLNAITRHILAPELMLEQIAAWNKEAAQVAQSNGEYFEPLTLSQLLEASQGQLNETDAGSWNYPIYSFIHRLLQGAVESVNAENAVQQIAAANDFMRKHPGLAGEWVMTPVVQALSEEERQQLIQKVIDFDDFSAENDPWREHDFGMVLQNGERYFYKIDYFDKEPQPDAEGKYLYAENLSEVRRVLTLLHASEY